MGRLIVVLALAGAAALVTHPGGDARAHSNLPGAKVQAGSPEDHVLAAARRDLEQRQSELGPGRVGADGTQARALTAGESTNTQPTFSPDGRQLGFLSTRSGEPQLWVLPMAGGEPEQKTSFPGGVGEFLWFPDGRRVVAAVDVHPECGADAECNRRKDEARAKGALKAHLADRLLYRHWTQWQEGKRSH